MSSSTPPDPSEQEPEPDETDTGPLQAVSPEETSDDGWDQNAQWTEPPPTQETWAGRFDAPLTVNPRQTRRQRNTKPFVVAAAVVGAVAVVGGVISWMTAQSSSSDNESSTAGTTTSSPEPTADAEDQSLLQRQLPKGYGTAACSAGALSDGVVAQFECEQNADAGGPLSATYTLVKDQAALDAIFYTAVAAAQQVNCPGNIQSPGPWRRNASPEKVSGQLFCGLRDSHPTIVWTDVDRMMVSAVRAGPQGPNFPELYAWWSSHS